MFPLTLDTVTGNVEGGAVIAGHLVTPSVPLILFDLFVDDTFGDGIQFTSTLN